MSPSRAGVRVVGSGAGDGGDDDEGDHIEEHELEAAGPRRIPYLLLAVAIVALLGIFGTVFYFHRYSTLSNRNHRAADVAKVSNQFLLALSNFDANSFDAAVQRVESFATGDALDQLRGTYTSDIGQALAKVQATERGQIRFLYVQSLQGDTATTYAEVDETIANLKFSHPEPDVLRIALTLKHIAGTWKISEIDVLQGPATALPSAGSTTTTTAPPSR